MNREPQFDPDVAETEFERRVAEAEAALEAMPDPAPTTSRQVVIASREKIKRKAAALGQGGIKKVWQVYVSLGHKIEFSTFRDYVYNGEVSREAKGAEMGRKTRRTRKIPIVRQDAVGEPEAEPSIVTESTAGGRPVLARKVL